MPLSPGSFPPRPPTRSIGVPGVVFGSGPAAAHARQLKDTGKGRVDEELCDLPIAEGRKPQRA
jgi:hypothetical protein